MALFSTTRYNEVAHISVSSPNGDSLGDIPITHFHLIQRNGKADKRVFITQIPLPDTPQDGWYQATVTLNNGKQFQARDYVIAAVMERAEGMQPTHDAEGLPSPVWPCPRVCCSPAVFMPGRCTPGTLTNIFSLAILMQAQSAPGHLSPSQKTSHA